MSIGRFRFVEAVRHTMDATRDFSSRCGERLRKRGRTGKKASRPPKTIRRHSSTQEIIDFLLTRQKEEDSLQGSRVLHGVLLAVSIHGTLIVAAAAVMYLTRSSSDSENLGRTIADLVFWVTVSMMPLTFLLLTAQMFFSSNDLVFKTLRGLKKHTKIEPVTEKKREAKLAPTERKRFDASARSRQTSPADFIPRLRLVVFTILMTITFSTWALAIKYAENRYFDPASQFDDVDSFSEGLAHVEKAGKHGYVDKAYQIVIPITFDRAYSFHQGQAMVMQNGFWGIIDRQGKFVIPAKFEELTHFFGETAPARTNGKWGYINKTGTYVIPAVFEDIKEFSCGLAAAKQNGKWGYIDEAGKYVIAPVFDEAETFLYDRARVKANGKVGIIDPKGKLVRH